jgi:tRNA modification GTPase
VELLRAQLKQAAGFVAAGEDALGARQRHLDALARARTHLEAADVHAKARAGELLAEELRLVQQALGEITGEVTSEDLLGKIFASFCIGK